MTMVPFRTCRGMLVGVALLALAVAPGCDWLKSSGPGPRSSPVISGLSIEDASGVFCGPENAYQISFRYNDPQDDIFQVFLTFTHKASGAVLEQRPLWSTFDLGISPGRAVTEHFFPCGSPGGLWELQVEAEDAEGHKSNVLTGEVVLASR